LVPRIRRQHPPPARTRPVLYDHDPRKIYQYRCPRDGRWVLIVTTNQWVEYVSRSTMSTREIADPNRGSGTDGKATTHGEPAGRREHPHGPTERVLRPGESDEFAAVLDLLEDEYTRRILEALAEGARPARALIDACDASRATVYRRLNCLQDHGLVEVGVEPHREGHHRKVFESLLERATVEVGNGTTTLRLLLAIEDQGTDRDRPVPA
jgi:DNA-binding HxlR family transcriptional regulator